MTSNVAATPPYMVEPCILFRDYFFSLNHQLDIVSVLDENDKLPSVPNRRCDLKTRSAIYRLEFELLSDCGRPDFPKDKHIYYIRMKHMAETTSRQFMRDADGQLNQNKK